MRPGETVSRSHIYVGDLFLDSTLASLLGHPHIHLRLHFRFRLYLHLCFSPHSHPRLRLRHCRPHSRGHHWYVLYWFL